MINENVIVLYRNLRKFKLYKVLKHLSSETSGNQPHVYIFYPLSENSWNISIFNSLRQLHNTLRSSNDDKMCGLLDSSSDLFELGGIKALMCVQEEFFSEKPQSDLP